MTDSAASVLAPAPASTSTSTSKLKKEAPKNLVIPPKKPKLSKAERRALQESQRADKAVVAPKKHITKEPLIPEAKSPSVTTNVLPSPTIDTKAISTLAHLPPFRDPTGPEFSGVTLGGPENSNLLHPAVLKLGLAYAKGHIRGGNPRARTMLECFSQVIQDYTPPPNTKDIRHHLDQHILKPSFTYWTTMCRPHSVSMGNAFTFLKTTVTSLPRDNMTLDDMIQTLVEAIHDYIREHITYADQAIANVAAEKIVNGDVLLTFGNPSILPVLVQTALSQNKTFRIIVVDSRPLLEGKKLVQQLQQQHSNNISITYILLPALSYVMPQVTKVILGASALLSEGSVLSRVGTACIAISAHSAGIPVLVCAETYKMSHRTQLESITQNELGDPNDVCQGEWRVMNLLYDLTPSHMVSTIVTELGMLPPTSVAVLLREMNPGSTGTY